MVCSATQILSKFAADFSAIHDDSIRNALDEFTFRQEPGLEFGIRYEIENGDLGET